MLKFLCVQIYKNERKTMKKTEIRGGKSEN